MICFDFSFIRSKNILNLFLNFSELKNPSNIIFKEIISIFIILLCAIISAWICNFKNNRNNKINKMIIIGFILLIGTIIKYNILSSEYFGVIRLVIYVILILEALVMIYINKFEDISNDLRENLKDITKIKDSANRISLIQYFNKEVYFYLDKLIMGCLFLGTAFTAIMSILWLSNMFAGSTEIERHYILNLRSTISVCIGFGFVLLEIFLWCFKPLWDCTVCLRKVLKVNNFLK